MKMTKLLLSSLLISSMMVFGVAHAAATKASSVKIGVIDLQQIAEQSPEKDKVNKKIEKQFKPREKQIIKAQDALKADMEKFDRDASIMSETQLNDLQDKIISDRANLQSMQETFRQDLRLAQARAYRRFLSDVNKVVDKIAKDKNYTIVIQKQSAVYVSPDADITAQVVAAMK